jgi:hypothetical protein
LYRTERESARKIRVSAAISQHLSCSKTDDVELSSYFHTKKQKNIFRVTQRIFRVSHSFFHFRHPKSART